MRRFYLKRYVDLSGNSGTGRVADGAAFADGIAVIRWLGSRPSRQSSGNRLNMPSRSTVTVAQLSLSGLTRMSRKPDWPSWLYPVLMFAAAAVILFAVWKG